MRIRLGKRIQEIRIEKSMTQESLATISGLDRVSIDYIELKDKKLSYILNDPLRTIVETKKKSLSAHNSDIWCGSQDSIQCIDD